MHQPFILVTKDAGHGEGERENTKFLARGKALKAQAVNHRESRDTQSPSQWTGHETIREQNLHCPRDDWILKAVNVQKVWFVNIITSCSSWCMSIVSIHAVRWNFCNESIYRSDGKSLYVTIVDIIDKDSCADDC